MKITVEEIAELFEGKIFGDEAVEVDGVSTIKEAGKNDLTFIYRSDYAHLLQTTEAKVVLINKSITKTRDDIVYIEVEKPDIAIQKVVIKYFDYAIPFMGIDKLASIHETATIGSNVTIGKNVVISENCAIGDDTKILHNTVILENVTIGSNVLIYPNVTINYGIKIGDNVIIHSNTVVGSDGFGYFKNDDGSYTKVPQIGNVIIENNVELGSNVSIDRSAMTSTIIKEGAKIDNLVQIGHNVVIGKHTSLSGQVGVAGSTTVGNNCIFGGQVGLAGHIEVTDNVIIGAQSGVSKSIIKPGMYFGTPTKEYRVALREEGHKRNLEKYSKQIVEFKNEIANLEKIINKEIGK